MYDYFEVSFGYLIGQTENRFDGTKSPNNETAAKWSDEEDMEDFLRMAKLFWHLSPHSKRIVKGCIALAYKTDRLYGTLVKNRFKVSVDWSSADDEELDEE